MVRPVRLTLVCLTFVGLVAASAPADAETIRQTVDVIGWTNTGSELVTSVTLEASGINAEGDPIDWTYSVLEVRNARSGKVLSRYQVGAPPSVMQRGWETAKSEKDGRTFLTKVGVTTTEDSQVSPDGVRVLVDVNGVDSVPMSTISDTCPGCNECTTKLELTLLDGAARFAYLLPSQTRTGNPYAPGDANPDCPKLGVRAFWHPSEPRLAVVLTEEIASTGALLESVRAYDLDKDSSGWKSTALSPPSSDMRASRLRTEEERLRAALAEADADSKAGLLTALGDHLRQSGDLEGAAGYYESALAFDKKSQLAALGRAHVFLARGELKKAMKLARKVQKRDRRSGTLNAELGLFHIAAGDMNGAQPFLQASVDSDGGANPEARLRLGHQIMDADLSAGLAYMDNLYRGLDTDAVGADLLAHSTVRVAEAHIHLRDLTAAAGYLKWLDTKGPDARRLALLIGALRSRDESRMMPILDGVDALLASAPGDCGLYYVKGMAYLRLTRPRAAYVNLAAALACDPALEEAHYYLADMYRFAGRMEAGKRHFERYLELAPERRGDDARRLRRAVAAAMVPRMAHTGVVLVRWKCESSDTVSCTGVLLNNSPAPTGPVRVSLSSTREVRRKITEGPRSDTTVADIAPGQSVNFTIRLALPEPGFTVALDAGRSEVERELNHTPVGY
jgi:Tfp pilus assembly protein PilF